MACALPPPDPRIALKAVRLAPGVLGSMQAHARADYPNECCGFLLARADRTAGGDPRIVLGVQPAANRSDGEPRRRFVIRPDELRNAEARTKGTSLVVGGFYHSHPDHPALPSQVDEDHAWPWYAYLIVSMSASGVARVGAFELDPESRRFRAVPLEESARGTTDTETVSAAATR